ncbi:hypothetical protein QL093DRAFT_2595021 [Fusarium oxysporum]|nr:hypothetical protein QL093DRAFT_2595021 [Fusarium oxysporum]
MDGRRYLLVPQGNNCIYCNDGTELQCPKCSDGESCQFTVPLDCTQCATSVCMQDEEAGSDKGGGGLNIGGIIGGIVGGIVMLAVATCLVWRFYIRPKRSQTPISMYVEDVDLVQGSEKDAPSRGTRPPSACTVHSIAPTVLTRASNIIQIAYIPVVTNRVTPMPPNGNQAQGIDDEHFVVPSDLQDSAYLGLSGYSDRTSYARWRDSSYWVRSL